VLTSLVLLAPLLLLARRWHLPVGAATIGFAIAALISAVLMSFELFTIPIAIVAAGVLVDLLALWLRPRADRRAAFWLFGALAALVTWAVYIGTAAVTTGRLPAIVEFWTGMPVIAALLGWALAALMLPNAITASERVAATSD
jgi:hypothetical protein